jgi:hypothetical protein
MIPTLAWPENMQRALREGRFEQVLAWIEEEGPLDAGLLKASVYEWWGKPMDAVDVLTRTLKSLPRSTRTEYIWYRGLMYIHASMPAWAEQDFDVVLLQSRAHPQLTKLARAYAKVLLGDVRGALEDIDGLPLNTTLMLDRIVTPVWIENYTAATLHRGTLKERNVDDAMV